MDEISLHKNVLDLEHSETLSRGITELSIAVGGFFAILISLYNKELIFVLVAASIFATMFLIDGMNKLERCRSIRRDILGIIKRKGYA